MATPQRIKLPVRDQRVEDILLWRDPKKSGIALGACTATYVLINYIAYNPVVVFANMLQFAVIVAFVWNTLANFLKKPGVPIPRVVKEGVSEGHAKDIAARYTVYVNKVLAFVERVLSGRDVVLSLQVAGALFVVARVAAVVSLPTLAYLGTLLLFTLPKLYELKKDEIDGHLSKAKEQYNTVYSKHVDPLVKKIPRASTATTSASAPASKMDEVAREVKSMMEDVGAGGKKYF